MQFTLYNLKQKPDFADIVAHWQHSECVREGLASSLPLRRGRLTRHLNSRSNIPTTWVAAEDGQPLGCASLVSYHAGGRDQRWQRGDPLWVSGVYVIPDFRRRGLARALLARVAEEAGELGADSLWLFTRDAEAFYRHLGWQRMRETTLAGRAVTLMQKTVETPSARRGGH